MATPGLSCQDPADSRFPGCGSPSARRHGYRMTAALRGRDISEDRLRGHRMMPVFLKKETGDGGIPRRGGHGKAQQSTSTIKTGICLTRQCGNGPQGRVPGDQSRGGPERGDADGEGEGVEAGHPGPLGAVDDHDARDAEGHRLPGGGRFAQERQGDGRGRPGQRRVCGKDRRGWLRQGRRGSGQDTASARTAWSASRPAGRG